MNVPESTNCIKCNCKLNNLKAINSENSTLKNLNDTKRVSSTIFYFERPFRYFKYIRNLNFANRPLLKYLSFK